MHKIITEETIRQACSSRISQIREEGNSLLKTVEEETAKIEEQFVGAIESAGFSSNAFVPFCKMDSLLTLGSSLMVYMLGCLSILLLAQISFRRFFLSPNQMQRVSVLIQLAIYR